MDHPTQNPQSFDEWWQANYADVPGGFADRTFGEEVWNAAREAVLMSLLGAGEEEGAGQDSKQKQEVN